MLTCLVQNEQLLISDWEFRYTASSNDPSKCRDFDPFLQKADAVATSIDELRRFNAQDKLFVGYAFCEITKESVSPHTFYVKMSVAQKIHANERNMTVQRELVRPRPILLRTLAAQGICAIRSLHEAKINHTSLSIGSVWMSDAKSNAGFRFSDFGSMGQLLDLMKMFSSICNDQPYVDEEPTDRTGKDRLRQDCFHLGTLLHLVITDPNSSVSPDSRPSRSQDLVVDFIKVCQEAKNMDALMNHDFLKC